MPNATVTIRELRNKDTGIDIGIPSHKEIPGLLTTTVEYHVVTVTNLQCFKQPKHKETDVVQFMVPKHIDDFEELKKKLLTKFPGTVFPILPKKSFVLLETSVKERRNLLENFLKFLAGTSKLASSPVLLQFLGANPFRAGTYQAEDVLRSDQTDLFEERRNERGRVPTDLPSPGGDLFGEEDEDETDLFTMTNDSMKTSESAGALFRDSAATTPIEPKKGGIKLFEDQDLGGALRTDETSSLLLLSDNSDQNIQNQNLETEDHSDLLKIEDDLDQLLKVTQSPRKKPDIPSKPKLSPKPAVAPKPTSVNKPVPSKKPGTKPAVARKPGKGEPVVLEEKGQKETTELFPSAALVSPSTVDELDSTDILKYIEASSTTTDADLDLFS